MRVEQLMTRTVQTCRPQDSLEHAAQLMWNHDCGCLPVCEGNGITRTVGIVTDRDICMSALFQGKPLRDLPVADAMAKQLLTCAPGDSLAEVESAMREAQIRRMPVVDEDKGLVGIISIADLAREAGGKQSGAKREITEEEITGTLAAICTPTGSWATA